MTHLKNKHLKGGALYIPAQYVSIIREAIKKWTTT